MQEYIGILIMFLFAGLIGAAFLVLSATLGPKAPSPVKSEPFECGETPFALPSGRFSVKFYLVGMLFILFDVELVFLFPWAVVYRHLGLYGFLEMLVFLGIVVIGFVYAWKKGALDWA
jgi:NADH-quinone oxidoreductase subunit A